MGTQTDNSRYTGYPLFKGLQRPLELMGLQGRYIYWAAGAVGGAILGFILAYCLIGFLAGLLTLVASLAVFQQLMKGEKKKQISISKAGSRNMSRYTVVMNFIPKIAFSPLWIEK